MSGNIRPQVRATEDLWLRRSYATLGVGLALVALVAALYWPVGDYDFISLDDSGYVFSNPKVRSGLSWEGVGWAFTTFHKSNWHPLTWLSHMLDSQLFGVTSGGPHAINVALHAANAVLLFLVLRWMTGAFWPSAFVAALFAVHPLRVESVAWVSERKDVLGGFFWMTTLLAYVGYVRRPGVLLYWMVLISFGMGLMAKPMLVTLPCVLLLLDFWPLGRWRPGNFRPLILEKLPLLALAAISSVLTLLAQRSSGALGTLEAVPLGSRVANALVAYVAYLSKTFWPTKLAAFYPHPALVPSETGPLVAETLGAALLLVAVSVCVLYMIKRRPYLTLGWLWYLGTLLPVIGIVHVGFQAMADRYSYLPLIGIYIAIAWAGRELVLRWRSARLVVAITAVASLIACTLITRSQIPTWRDSTSVFAHAIEVTRDNYFAHANLGSILLAHGNVDDAMAHYEKALRIRPDYPTALTGLGTIYARQGQIDRAIDLHQRALNARPDSAIVLNNLGAALYQKGELIAAAQVFERALELEPDYAMGHSNLGSIYFRLGQLGQAEEHLERALSIEPDYVAAHNNLGAVLVQQGRLQEAVAHFEHALRIQPDHAMSRQNLNEVQALLGSGP